MRHDARRKELQAECDSLTTLIAVAERELSTTVDDTRRLVVATERDDLYDRRRRVVDQMVALPRQTTSGEHVEYDELTRMMYELKSDVTIMKRLLDDHVSRCGPESAGFPSNFLVFLAVGGVVTLLMLAFIVVRIGMAG